MQGNSWGRRFRLPGRPRAGENAGPTLPPEWWPSPVAIVAAHPDDEVIGAGAHLPQFENLTLIHVTDGAPRDMRDAFSKGFQTREEYASARRRELECALETGGVKPRRTLQLGFGDQDASLDLIGLTERLAEVLDEIGPALVITHPYEGGHPDHDASAFAVHLWAKRTGAQVVEMTSYHARDGALAPFEFLHSSEREWLVPLTEEQRAMKRRMYDCFATQAHVLERFPIEIERFRNAPAYDFTQAPHEGALHYERFDWGWTGERWRALASRALGVMR